MSNNIYDILNNLSKSTPVSTVEAEPIYESVDPRGDIMEAINTLEAKFDKFNSNDEAEDKYLNPQAKRFVQLAKAKFPETSSDLEAVVAAIGDKTEELDRRDRETGEWMNKAKSTIDSQQKEIKQTEQAVTDANARYDAQEKRFQDFTQQVAAANLPVQQQAQAAVDFAKATKDTGAAPEKIAARGKEIVAKAKEKVKTKEKEQPSIQNQPVVDIDTDIAGVDDQDSTKSTADSSLARSVQDLLKNQPSPNEIPQITPAPISTAPKTQQKNYGKAADLLKKRSGAKLEEALLNELSPTASKNTMALYQWSDAWAKYQEAMELGPQPGQALPTAPQESIKLEFADGAVNISKATMDKFITILTKMSAKQQDQFINNVLGDRSQFVWFIKNINEPAPKKAAPAPAPLKKGQTQDLFAPLANTPTGTQGQFDLGTPTMNETINKLATSLMERFAKFSEDAKPDFLDLDKDGDTDEPMKSAAKSAKKHEPAEIDKDAVAKRKRLQALKDKQEDERAEKGDYDSKSSSRVVKGRAYGGSAQKDDEDKDEVDESGLQAYLGKKKYGKEGMKALQQAGREGAGKETMAKLRARHDKFDESAKPDYIDLDKDGNKTEPMKKAAKDAKQVDEVAPPGAKAERMVKHIKKGYSKDGNLSKKEKGIAYATAWKARNKGQVEEATKFGDTIKNSKVELKKHKMVKEGRNPESSEYTYETIGRVLCDEQPGLDVNSEAFVKAVYDELIELKLTPKAARWLVHYDEDFIGDAATSYGHFCASKEKEAMECGAPMNSFVSEEPLLDAEHELAEIAKLAGLAREDFNPMVPGDSASPLTYAGCSKCNADPCCCEDVKAMDEGMGCSEEELNEAATRKDFRMVADLLKSIPDIAKRTELAMYHADIFKQQNPRFKKEMFLAAAGVDTTPIKDAEDEVLVSEEEVGEGNEFSGALAKARADGKKEFEVDGKKYTVKEDINLNVSANGEEDVVNLIRKLSGMPVVAIQAQPAMVEEVVAEEGPTERDVEYANTPHEDVAGTDAAIPSGTGEDRAKKMYRKEYPGDNPMAVAEAKEESLWKAYESMINDVKA
jgi:hypothetical protein